MEQWRDLKGMEEFFLVSNKGNVKSKSRYVNNNGTMVMKDERILKPFKTSLGYYQINLTIKNKTIKKYVHVIVLESFSDRPSEEHEVNHIDHDKSNNNLENLEWVTRQENQQKMAIHYGGRINGLCKNCNKEFSYKKSQKLEFCSNKCSGLYKRLTDRPTKEELFELIKNNPFTKIGKMYGVSDNAIRRWCKSYELPTKKKDIEKLK